MLVLVEVGLLVDMLVPHLGAGHGEEVFAFNFFMGFGMAGARRSQQQQQATYRRPEKFRGYIGMLCFEAYCASTL